MTNALRNTIFGAAMTAAAAITPAFAQQAANDSTIQQVASRFEAVDSQTARDRSVGGITLHVGAGFPEIPVIAISEILAERGYRVNVFAGGPTNELGLCIDGQCSGRNFDMSTIDVLTIVVENNAQHLLASRGNAPEANRS